jgi:glyoxylase-like metal-dependent hydrolase (beta-lactamase superfamily II)
MTKGTAMESAVQQLPDAVVGSMMGAEWPVERIFPNRVLDDGDRVRLGGLTFTVDELGPGESHVDTMWWLDPGTVFSSDLAYNGMHAYQADGRWAEWLTSLGTFEARLDDDATLHVGHGAPGTKAPLTSQRRYIEAFVAALDANLDAITAVTTTPSSPR